MAISAKRLATLRRELALRVANVNYTKPEVNAAFQAVKDNMVANRPSLRTDIETAAATVFNLGQKNHIIDTIEETPPGAA